MKKILILFLSIIILNSNVFAASYFNPPTIILVSSQDPCIMETKIQRNQDKSKIALVGNLWVDYSKVSVTLNSPYKGLVNFNCILRNTSTKQDLNITLPYVVNYGVNYIEDFYQLPAYVMNIYSSSGQWITFYDVLFIQNITPVA